MAIPDHYQILEVHPAATQVEIKQAYRRLAKRFHPDHNPQGPTNHDRISRINAAYEVLGDPHHRQLYDQQRYGYQRQVTASHRAAAAQTQHQHRQTGQDTDEHLQRWLQQVYRPVNQFLREILRPLEEQLEYLADDPYDDELMAEFQTYLQECRDTLSTARRCFQSMPNPANLAGVAANLYYCLNQIGDGLEDLDLFTQSYDDHYLHTGQELFRIARGLQREAAAGVGRL